MKRSVCINNGLLELVIYCIYFEGLVAYFYRADASLLRVTVKTFELPKRQALLFQHVVTSHSKWLAFGEDVLVEMNFLCQGVQLVKEWTLRGFYSKWNRFLQNFDIVFIHFNLFFVCGILDPCFSSHEILKRGEVLIEILHAFRA